ncbi:CBS domain-containing protein [Paenibacillus endoradicis]|uniref:CBS domain-containing protein n=1 Tax=Paenibacillus endoradicis TaxID=2972487 RepID=UPI002158BB93|nr:CBS domain-containing protein [Paenibacillus endoradicis]MCR8657114.1 CBS domain-containing protein [Paenibacillus endoradicis]
MITVNITSYVQFAPTINMKATCKMTLQCLQTYPLAEAIIVVNDENVVIGIISSKSFYLKLSSGYAIENLYNKPISQLMISPPLTVDVNISVTQLQEQNLLVKNSHYPLVVVQNNAPIGILSVENYHLLTVPPSDDYPLSTSIASTYTNQFSF